MEPVKKFHTWICLDISHNPMLDLLMPGPVNGEVERTWIGFGTEKEAKAYAGREGSTTIAITRICLPL